MNRTMKLPINAGYKKEILLKTLQVASQVYNQHSEFGFENKSWSKNMMHKQLYRAVRSAFPEFPSALVQTVRDNACESLKSMNSNKKWKSQPIKKPHASLRYDKRTCTLKLLKKEASLSWIDNGRCHLTFEIPDYYEKYLTQNSRNLEFAII